MEVLQCVDNEAGLYLGNVLVDFCNDLFGGLTLFGHDSGIQNKVTTACGEVKCVYNIDIFKFFSGKSCVCVAAGEATADVKVDNSVVIFKSFLKKVCIVSYVESRCLANACTAVNIIENVVRCDLKTVSERLVSFVYVQGDDLNIVFLNKLF